jgi:class 3 adenylate cyclase
MGRLLGRLLTIGAEPADDEDTRLRKVLLLVAAFTIAPLAVLWGLLYWLAGEREAALIPWAYAAISAIGIAAFGVSRHYATFAISQFVPYMILPFLLMSVLGGPIEGSVVALWAGLAPLVALLLGHRRAAFVLAAVYAALMVLSVLADPTAGDATRTVFFVLNLVGVPLVAWLLVRVFAGGRESALVAVRSVVHRYLPPELVSAIRADPGRLGLGGQIAEVTSMFADLGGYSSYAESRSPAEVVELLNRYFAAALPIVLEEGGTPIQLPGDAIFAVFGAPTPRSDHAVRACRAAHRLLDATAPLAEAPTNGPRFSIGVNSGPALVGNIGSDEYRNFTAIGDTTNVAARLQGLAGPGEIVIGPLTARLLGEGVALEPMGAVSVKGRAQAVEAFRVRRRL